MEIVTKIAPLALAFIMLGLGLGLSIKDFTRVIKTPKDFLIGIVCQLILLPIVAYIITIILRLPIEIALGLMIICLFFLRGTIDQWVDYSFIQRAANLLLIITLSGAIYFVSLKFLGFEFNSFLRKSHHSS